VFPGAIAAAWLTSSPPAAPQKQSRVFGGLQMLAGGLEALMCVFGSTRMALHAVMLCMCGSVVWHVRGHQHVYWGLNKVS
jgi:hypothetical protein